MYVKLGKRCCLENGLENLKGLAGLIISLSKNFILYLIFKSILHFTQMYCTGIINLISGRYFYYVYGKGTSFE